MNEHNLSLEKFLSELRTITEWTVPLDENDWQSFQDNGNNHVLVLKTATDDFTEPYLLTLCHHIVEQYKKKEVPCANLIEVLILLRYPVQVSPMMNEIAMAHERIKQIAPHYIDCEIKWGLSPKMEGSCEMTCAFNHVNDA